MQPTNERKSARACSRTLARFGPALLLALVVALFMRGWWNAALPATPRLELTPGLGQIWRWRWRFLEGEGLSAWNHLVLTGEPVLTSRGWIIYSGLGLLSLGTGLSPEWLLKLVHFAMVVLGGWGMMAFVRRLGAAWPGALVAGLVYVLYPMRVFITVEAIFMVIGWAAIPWGFWGYERLRASTSRKEGLWVGVLWGLILAWVALSSLQLFMLELMLLGLYVVLRELAALAVRREIQVRPFPLAGLAGAASVTLGLILYFYLPSLVEQDLLGLRRYLEAWPRETVLPAPLPLLAWVLGARFRPGFEPLSVDHYIMIVDFAFYLGWSVLLLALMGLVGRRKSAVAWCLAGVVVFSFLLAVGPGVPYNPVYWLIRRLPVLADLVRNSFRGLLGISLGLAGLAGMGVDWLLERFQRPALRWGLVGALGLLVVADLWPGSLAYASVDQYLHPDEIAAHRWVDTQEGEYRYWVPIQVEPYGWHYVRSSAGAQYNQQSVITQDAFSAPTFPWHALRVLTLAIDEEIEGLEGGMTPSGQAALSLVGARYGLVHRNAPAYEAVVRRLEGERGWRVLRQTEHVYLLENPAARPYLQAYGRGVVVAGDVEALLEHLPGCLERGYALVAGIEGKGLWISAGQDGCGSLPVLPEVGAQLAGGPPVRDEIRVETDADSTFLLMVAESWYPHWRVEVDGEEAPLLRVNGGFLGAAVPAGEHTVRFRYQVPWYQVLGLAVSLATLLALLVGGAVALARSLARDS